MLDSNYRMPKTVGACDLIVDKVSILNNLIDYYYAYNNEDGEMVGPEYPFDYIRVLNHKILGGIRQLNQEEDNVKR